MTRLDRAEAHATATLAFLRRPAPYAALCVALVLTGLAVRLARVPTATDVFTGIPDSKQYVVQAYNLYLHGFFEPFAHRGDGWPLLLAAAMKLFGFVGTAGYSMAMAEPWDAEGWAAIRFAYAFHAVIAAALVPATILLARQLVGRLTAAGAALLVAIDPFLLSESTSVMADQLFALLVVLAFTAILYARRHPAWLFVAGSLLACAHMTRVNGILFIGTAILFAAFYLRKASPRHKTWHLVIPLVAFLVVAAPYLAWRDHYLPGPFDYGTNTRFWADDPWNFEDEYWQQYSYSQGGPKETAADYFATHSLWEALARLYQSGQWQLLDLTRVTLSPMLLLLGVAGMAASRKEPWGVLTPMIGLTLAASFFWIYPIVRSPRYFMVLIPLFAILAVHGARAAAHQTTRAALAASAIIAPYLVTYAVEPLLSIPRALALIDDPYVAPMVLLATCLMVLGVTIPIMSGHVRDALAFGRRTIGVPR